MVTVTQAKRRILALMPPLDGWPVYEDMALADAPPWVVVSVTQTGRDVNEAVNVTGRLFTLTVRVVGGSVDGVDHVCDLLQDAFDGRRPESMSALVPWSDSGTYPSELTDPQTGRPHPMRVLAWRVGE